MQEGSLFATPSPAFIVFRFFDDGHSDCCEVIPHCSFDLHFSNNESCWESFHIFISYWYVSFGVFCCTLKCTINMLYYLFNFILKSTYYIGEYKLKFSMTWLIKESKPTISCLRKFRLVIKGNVIKNNLVLLGRSLHIAIFMLFNGWVIFHCIYVPHLLYPFICEWTSRLLPYPSYCK